MKTIRYRGDCRKGKKREAMGRKIHIILLLVALLAYTSALVRGPRSTVCERRRPGRFITDDCKSLCTCRRDGSYYCSALCTFQRVSCNGSQRRVSFYKQISGSSKCTCPRQKCVPRQLPGTCVVRDKLYKVGKFVTDDCTAECECRSNGEYGCMALCPTGRVTCRPGERKITVQLPSRSSSRCTCPHHRCVSADSISAGRSDGGTCNVNGRHYKVGTFISEDCSGDCVCYRNGRFRCNSLCPPLGERCRSGEKEVTVQQSIGRGSNCKCPVQKCVPVTCSVKNISYRVGRFITRDCTRDCICYKNGEYRCRSLCRRRTVSCRPDQRKIISQEAVGRSSHCKCPVHKCIDQNKSDGGTCNVNGKHYKVGSFISEDCSGDCVCYRNGRIGCNSLCPPVSERCRSGEKEVTVQEPVGRGSNCKCPVQKCVPVTCNVRNISYRIGRFITRDCTRDCICYKNGEYRCRSLCQRRTVYCRPDQKKIISQEAVGRSSHCKCPVHKCIDQDKSDAHAGKCKVRGKIYKVGKFITDDCTAECNCYDDGRYGCKSLCPTRSVTCKPGQTKVTKHITVSNRCTCPVPQCFSEVFCDVRGRKYKVGPFITDDCSARCVCRSDGRYGCRSLCPRSSISCSSGQRKITVYEAVTGSSNCQCRLEKCI